MKLSLHFQYIILVTALLSLFLPPILAQQTLGLFQNDSLAYNGYTLFGNNQNTYLIDNCGYEVHRWESNFKPGQTMYLLDNGNLLRTASINGTFNAGGLGGRFELFNWEGDLLWYLTYATDKVHAHHDIAPMPNGHFLLIAWEFHSEEAAAQQGSQAGHDIWSERIVEVAIGNNNTATIIWEWHLWDHLIQDVDQGKVNYGFVADHPERIDINFEGTPGANPADWFHLNSIDYNPDLDQIVVSSRNYSEIWIIDHSTSTEEAAGHSGGLSGKGGDLLYRCGNPQVYRKGTTSDQHFFLPHDVHWIPEGLPYENHLMVYNNEFTNNGSRVEIWLPSVDASGKYLIEDSAPNLVWAYKEPGFYSAIMSGAQVLPNGNVLICEGETGRFFEVTPGKETVWEYVNPINRFSGPMAQRASVRFNETFRATRYDINHPAFVNKKLTPGPPIELNPSENEFCRYSFNESPALSLTVKGNPFQKNLIIFNNQPTEKIPLAIYDVNGRLVHEHTLRFGDNLISLEYLSKGIYFAIYFYKGERFYLETVIRDL